MPTFCVVPKWVPDPEFHMDNHVSRAALPEPGGEAELLEWAAGFWSQRLDRMRPLWEAVLVEGLTHGRWAICTKTHHCMIDGVGSVDAAYVMLDRAPGALPIVPSPSPHPSSERHGRLHGVAAGTARALDPRRVPELLRESRAAAGIVLHDEIAGAPHSSLNVPLGTLRRLAVVRVQLAEMKRVKRTLGGTVNDVVLASVTGGLRRLLLARGDDLPLDGLRAMVPVNVRAHEDHGTPGNKVASLFVELPVAEPDPAERHRTIVHEAQARKRGSQSIGSATIVDLAGLAPPALHSIFARSIFGTRLFNLTVTNVPGPPERLYALGAPLREVFGLVPLAAEHAVGIAVVSYDGKVTYTLNADRDAVRDLGTLAAGIEAELEALHALSASGRGRNLGKNALGDVDEAV